MTAARVIGGVWTPDPRPCDDCGAEHKHLTSMSDGRDLCIPCAYPRMAAQLPAHPRADDPAAPLRSTG